MLVRRKKPIAKIVTYICKKRLPIRVFVRQCSGYGVCCGRRHGMLLSTIAPDRWVNKRSPAEGF